MKAAPLIPMGVHHQDLVAVMIQILILIEKEYVVPLFVKKFVKKVNAVFTIFILLIIHSCNDINFFISSQRGLVTNHHHATH